MRIFFSWRPYLARYTLSTHFLVTYCTRWVQKQNSKSVCDQKASQTDFKTTCNLFEKMCEMMRNLNTLISKTSHHRHREQGFPCKKDRIWEVWLHHREKHRLSSQLHLIPGKILHHMQKRSIHHFQEHQNFLHR